MSIEVFPLDKTVMLDCGLHMGFNDIQRYPDFSRIKIEKKTFTEIIDLVLISHFHLDHVGALPYFTEIVGYEGKILMTTPTKAIVPYMLEDFRKVMLDTRQTEDKENSQNLPIYSVAQIANSMKKIITMQVHEQILFKDLKITSYYAGHVLGACMFAIEYKGASVVYTGDFNSNSDRHLGAAWIERLSPDLLISESTYATTVRDSKRSREREFLKEIQRTIDNKGKVLIPVFALGRAQELCLLLDTYWSRMKNTVPIYFSGGLIDKANFYYKLFVNWMNENIKNNYLTNNMLEFKHITPFKPMLTNNPEPMVLFATPGMLHGGLSLQVFKEWANDSRNTLIIPGYCVAGTIGNKLLSGEKKLIIDKKLIDININVKSMSFSAHADAKGILNLISQLQPKNVLFVHGEKNKMETLGNIVSENFKIPCFCPANFTKITIPVDEKISFNLPFSFNEKEKGMLVKYNSKNFDKEFLVFLNGRFLKEELENMIKALDIEYTVWEEVFEVGKCFEIDKNILNKFQNKNNVIKFFEEKIEKLPNKEKVLSQYKLSIKNEFLLIKIIKEENCFENCEKIYDWLIQYNNL